MRSSTKTALPKLCRDEAPSAKFASKRENFIVTDHKPGSGFFDVFGGPSLWPKSVLA